MRIWLPAGNFARGMEQLTLGCLPITWAAVHDKANAEFILKKISRMGVGLPPSREFQRFCIRLRGREAVGIGGAHAFRRPSCGSRR